MSKDFYWVLIMLGKASSKGHPHLILTSAWGRGHYHLHCSNEKLGVKRENTPIFKAALFIRAPKVEKTQSCPSTDE